MHRTRTTLSALTLSLLLSACAGESAETDIVGLAEDTSGLDDFGGADMDAGEGGLDGPTDAVEDSNTAEDSDAQDANAAQDSALLEDATSPCEDGCPAQASCGPEGECLCDDGYAWDEDECLDIDECATDNGGCGDAAEVSCENQPGGPSVCTPFCGAALPSVSTCDVRLGLQGHYATQDYGTFGIGTDVVFVSGYAVRAPGVSKSNPVLEDAKIVSYNIFWSADAESIRTTLNSYCSAQLGGSCDGDGEGCCAAIEGMVIIDIEHPYHPSRLEGFDEEGQALGLAPHSLQEVVAAIQLRIQVVKEEMPNASVGLYGVFVGTAQTSLSAGLEAHLAKLKEAVALGLLDGLDFVQPVLYPRRGPGDVGYSQSHAAAYTDVCLEATLEAIAGLDAPPAIAPALALRIFNGNSKHQGEPAPAEYLSWQIEALLAHDEIETILFWAGSEDTIPGGPANTFSGLTQALSPCLCGEEKPSVELDDFSCTWEPHPLRAFTWDDPPQGYGASNLLTTYTAAFHGENGNTSPENSPLNATSASAKLGSMPEGSRAILWRAWDNEPYPAQHTEDLCWEPGSTPEAPVLTEWPGIWWTEGVAAGKAKVAAFYEELKALGTEVDVVFLDQEWGLGMWDFPHCYADPANAARYDAIEADPRYSAEGIASIIAPGGEAEAPNWLTANVCYWMDGGLAYLAWNQVMKARTSAYLDEMLYEPAAQVYEDLIMSNYNTTYFGRSEDHLPDANGHPHCGCDTPSQIVGTHQSREIYGRINQLADSYLDGNKPYGNTPFASFKLSVNQAKSVVLASKRVPFHLWVGPWSWMAPQDKEDGSTVHHSMMGQTDYWFESVFHAALTTPEDFVFWNIQSDKVAEDNTRLSEAMSEVEPLIGCAYRSPRVFELSDWGDDFVLSAARVEGRRVWRFTPRLEPGQSASELLTSVDPPTFTFNNEGETVSLSFPGGMLYTPPEPISSYGVWIVQWSNAPLPVLSSD